MENEIQDLPMKALIEALLMMFEPFSFFKCGIAAFEK